MLFSEGEILPIIKVKVLAVNESCKSRVNFDSRNAGTLLLPLDKLYITFPKVERDWLIFFNYLKCSSAIY